MSLTRDAWLVLAAQAVRAFAYGLGAVLLGTSLNERGLSELQLGVVLAAVVAGTVLASLAVARVGDRVGRRRCYGLLYAALALVGVVFAYSAAPVLLVLVALTGALSTEVVESGPFTSLEQAMLSTDLTGRTRVRGFGVYNAVASAAGSLGALAATLPGVLRHAWHGAPSDARWFLMLVPAALAGMVLSHQLSDRVEAGSFGRVEGATVGRVSASRPIVVRLACLFATDSFGGGFVVQSFIAFWLAHRFGASTGVVGVLFFAFGVLQTASFLAAPRLAERLGLLSTMVFTHLPSNVLLAAVAFAPTLPTAVALLLARVALSQMDVPARQAYVMGLVEPEERTAAAAYTNTARYIARPAGPVLAGVASSVALGAPFLIAGVIKAAYDVTLWSWFRRVPLPDEVEA
jgi:MFS family permease